MGDIGFRVLHKGSAHLLCEDRQAAKREINVWCRRDRTEAGVQLKALHWPSSV